RIFKQGNQRHERARVPQPTQVARRCPAHYPIGIAQGGDQFGNHFAVPWRNRDSVQACIHLVLLVLPNPLIQLHRPVVLARALYNPEAVRARRPETEEPAAFMITIANPQIHPQSKGTLTVQATITYDGNPGDPLFLTGQATSQGEPVRWIAATMVPVYPLP